MSALQGLGIFLLGMIAITIICFVIVIGAKYLSKRI